MLKLFRKKIGIVGYGNMGSAIASRLKKVYRVYIFDKDAVKVTRLAGVNALNSSAQVADTADAVIMAVKPQDLEAALSQTRQNLSGKLVISIAAGIPTNYIEGILGRVPVIRAMPNIGAIVGNSLTYVCKGHFAKDSDLNFAVRLFSRVGKVLVIAEDMMDAATAVGASAPGFWGYLFDKQPSEKWDAYGRDHFIPELRAAAISVGFGGQEALSTAEAVNSSSISITKALNITPAELTARVASKGGTTEAGLDVLKRGGSLTEAVKAAHARAKELARGK